MKSRRITIEEHDPDGNGYAKRAAASKIRLKGRWLQDAGFPPGATVQITVVSRGVIEIRLNGIQAQDGQYLIAADRLDVALAKDRARTEAA